MDDEYAGSLNMEEMALNDIKTGKDFDIEKFQEILARDNQKYAFNLALKYISIKRRTVSETKKYLLTKEIDTDVADTAVKKILDYGYLNDLEYAKDFVIYQINAAKYGRIVIIHKLKAKGIDEETIEEAMKIFDENIERGIAMGAYDKVRKKYRSLPGSKQRAKTYRALMSKGFSYDIIKAIQSDEDQE